MLSFLRVETSFTAPQRAQESVSISVRSRPKPRNHPASVHSLSRVHSYSRLCSRNPSASSHASRGTPRPSPHLPPGTPKDPPPGLPALTPTVPPPHCGGQNHISGLISLLQGLPAPRASTPLLTLCLLPTIPHSAPTASHQPCPASPHPQTGYAAPRGGPVPAGRAVCPSPTSPWTEAYPPILVALPLGPRASWGARRVRGESCLVGGASECAPQTWPVWNPNWCAECALIGGNWHEEAVGVMFES